MCSVNRKWEKISQRDLDWIHWKSKQTSWKQVMSVVHVLGISSGDLLISRKFKFWSTNICYCLLSAEKKRVWLVNNCKIISIFVLSSNYQIDDMCLKVCCQILLPIVIALLDVFITVRFWDDPTPWIEHTVYILRQ